MISPESCPMLTDPIGEEGQRVAGFVQRQFKQPAARRLCRISDDRGVA